MLLLCLGQCALSTFVPLSLSLSLYSWCNAFNSSVSLALMLTIGPVERSVRKVLVCRMWTVITKYNNVITEPACCSPSYHLLWCHSCFWGETRVLTLHTVAIYGEMFVTTLLMSHTFLFVMLFYETAYDHYFLKCYYSSSGETVFLSILMQCYAEGYLQFLYIHLNGMYLTYSLERLYIIIAF